MIDMAVLKSDFQKVLEGPQEQVAVMLKEYLDKGWEVEAGELIPDGFNRYRSRVYIVNPEIRRAADIKT